MDLDDVRTFLAVVESGSVVAATRALQVPRSSLRRRLEALEGAAGTQLFTRSASGAELTDAGAVLVEHARRLTRQYDALLAAARQAAGAPSGTVSVVISDGLPTWVAREVLTAVQEALPSVGWKVQRVRDVLGALVAGADLGVAVQAAPPEGGWRAVQLGVLREGLCASAAYLAERGAPDTVEALSEHPLFCWCTSDEACGSVPLLDGSALPLPARVVSDDERLVRGWVEAHAGIGLLPLTGRAGLEPVLAGVVGRERPVWWLAPEPAGCAPHLEAAFEVVARVAYKQPL